jgi:hypothetical protein
MDTRFEGTELPNTVDRLKQIVRNFRDRRTGLVPGGCPLLNTATDCDDGNPKLRAKARQALSSWLDRLQSIAEDGQRNGEVRSDVDSARLATLIASTLEGSGMVVVCSGIKSLLISPAVIWRNISEPKFVRGNRRPEPTSHEYSRNSLASGL